jgi:hypothetical protein
MVVDSLLAKKIRDGVRYEALPERLQQHISHSDWKQAYVPTA